MAERERQLKADRERQAQLRLHEQQEREKEKAEMEALEKARRVEQQEKEKQTFCSFPGNDVMQERRRMKEEERKKRHAVSFTLDAFKVGFASRSRVNFISYCPERNKVFPAVDFKIHGLQIDFTLSYVFLLILR